MEKEEKEIDLLELGKKLWDNKKFIIKCSLIGAIVGLVIAFSIPKEYTTNVILTTGSNNATGGGISSLASIAGISLGGDLGNDIFSPELYPEVLNSTPFIQGLLQIHLIDQEEEINTTLYNYIATQQKSAWWNYFLNIPTKLKFLFSSNDKQEETFAHLQNKRYISSKDIEIIESIKNTYSIKTDTKTGLTTIEVVTQNPRISGFLADTITTYLQKYIIEQRTKKATIDLVNSEKLYELAKDNYHKTQQNLASFIDSNMNVVSAKYKINQERLQNESNVAYSVYNQMAQQVQLNKIKVQNNTPVFTIIQPSIDPLGASSPQKKVILLIAVFIALVGASTYSLKDDIWTFIRE